MATKKVELNQLASQNPDTYDILVPNCILNADGTTGGLTQTDSNILSINNNTKRTIPQEEVWFISIPIDADDGITVQLTEYNKTIEKNKQYFFYVSDSPKFTVFTNTSKDTYKATVSWTNSNSENNIIRLVIYTCTLTFDFNGNTINFGPMYTRGIYFNSQTDQITSFNDYHSSTQVYNFGVLLV